MTDKTDKKAEDECVRVIADEAGFSIRFAMGTDRMAEISAVAEAFGASNATEYIEAALSDFLNEFVFHGAESAFPWWKLPRNKNEAREDVTQWLLFHYGDFEASGISSPEELAEAMVLWFGEDSATGRPVSDEAKLLLRAASEFIWRLDVRAARRAIDRVAEICGVERADD